jgi:hypothetical protein
VLVEKNNIRETVLPELADVVRTNYDDRLRFLRRAKRLGFEKAVDVIRLRLPTTARARSGDLGEILATNYVNATLGFTVPINRLQWKDGRNMPLRGDDLIGFKLTTSGKLAAILKGESKSRETVRAGVMSEAGAKLCEFGGRPSPHSVLFVADRLHELQSFALSEELEDYAVLGRSLPVTHLVFTLSGKTPEAVFVASLDEDYIPGIRRRLVGLVVDRHQEFIKTVFEVANA